MQQGRSRTDKFPLLGPRGGVSWFLRQDKGERVSRDGLGVLPIPLEGHCS